MTGLSRLPRQIVAFAAGRSVTSQAIQCVADSVPAFAHNHTDGAIAYCGVDFIGRHCRNIRDKSETHLIEGSNADIRHYIAGLARRSRCFFRSLRTLRAVLWLFIGAYNRFGEWKMKYRLRHPKRGRDYPRSHLDFVLSA
jgi:IS1 family transposase